MHRVVLVYRIFEDDEATRGIFQKLEDQKEAFERLGFEVDSFYLSSQGLMRNGMLVDSIHFEQRSKSMVLGMQFYKILLPHLLALRPKYVYMRYAPSSAGLGGFLQKIKNHDATTKIILEFATFPFLAEYKFGLKKMWVWWISSRLPLFSRLVDLSLYFGTADPSSLGFKSMKLSNGIRILSKAQRIHDPKKIRLLAIGSLHDWYGLDRLLYGMIAYYSQAHRPYQVTLKIIGDGPHLATLQKISTHPAITAKVFFVPPLYGTDLEPYLEQADLGVGVLAAYKKNLRDTTALKHRHYCMRGLPFFFAGGDEDFDQKPFVKSFPTDAGQINIADLIDFYTSIDFATTPEKMHRYAIQNLTWTPKFDAVLDRLQMLEEEE